MIEIKSLFGTTLMTIDRDDLRRANLSGADLRGADLCEADLRGADLCEADLRGAYLSGADLREADLREADLRGADLRGAYLSGADLCGATIYWQSHPLIAEILLRAAGDDPKLRMVAGLISVSTDWCWKEFASIRTPHRKWALTELAKWIQPNDSHPEILEKYREIS